MYRLIAMVLTISIGVSQSLAAAKVEGTCYNLPPNLVPITGARRPGVDEKITFVVQAVRDTNPLFRGAELTVQKPTFDAKTGKYSFEINLPDAKKPLAVFIDYQRDGFPTQTLQRIVLIEGVTNHIDLVVPLADQMNVPLEQATICPCCTPSHRRWLWLRQH